MSLKPPVAPNDPIDELPISVDVTEQPYGARGDGVTNDSASIQAAITAVGAAGGGVVYLPQGNYLLNSGLTVSNSSVAIEGAGRNATRLIANGNINILSVTSALSRLTIRNIWLGSDSVRGGGARAISIVPASGVVDGLQIERVRLQNMPALMYLENVQQSRIRDLDGINSLSGAVQGVAVHLKSCVSIRLEDWMIYTTNGQFGNDCLRLDSDCDTIEGHHLELLGAGARGLQMLNSVGGSSTGPRIVRLYGVVTEDATSSGVLISDGRDVLISGGESANNGADGVTVSGGTGVSIEGGFMALQNFNYGINLSGGTGHGVVHCKASNNGTQATNTWAGIRCAASNVRLLGNRSGDFIFPAGNRQKYGIDIAAATDHLAVSGNLLTDNSTGALNNASTGVNNQVASNVTA